MTNEIGAKIEPNVQMNSDGTAKYGLGIGLYYKYTEDRLVTSLSKNGLFGLGSTVNRVEKVETLSADSIQDLQQRLRTLLNSPISVEPYAVPSYWRKLNAQCDMISLLSGKGGVGKSSIALGLTEYYSNSGKVLLVDFDLFNRGLTSRYSSIPSETSTVLDEINTFIKTALPKFERNDQGRIDIGKLSEVDFGKIADFYTNVEGSNYNNPRRLKFLPLYLSTSTGSANTIINSYFLPGRRMIERYFGTDASRLSAEEIALFLMFFSRLVFFNGISKIILDCHGAQDLFAIGTIMASNRLVIVSQPDPASVEGTVELVAFSKALTDYIKSSQDQGKDDNTFAKPIFVLNNYRSTVHKEFDVLFTGLYNVGDTFLAVVKLPHKDELYKILQNYDSPKLLDDLEYLAAIEEIVGTKKKSIP